METFNDEKGGTVKLSFLNDSFSKQADHVLVICSFFDQWLLTKHKERGWSFLVAKENLVKLWKWQH